MRVITRWLDIPDFETPEDERKFWSETSLDPRLMNSSILKTDNRESMTVTLRFDPRMLARIKRIARSRRASRRIAGSPVLSIIGIALAIIHK